MITPCVKTCTLKEGYCTGCKRSKEEIMGWRNYSDEKRMEVMKDLENR